MLAQADGLECNCSQASSSLGNYPTMTNNNYINPYRYGNNLNTPIVHPSNGYLNNYNNLPTNGLYNYQQRYSNLISHPLSLNNIQPYLQRMKFNVV